MTSLLSAINGNYFQSYAYSYPHKSAYETLAQPRALEQLWADENKENLFLYLHVPFCEMRCGFCNLFTIANPKEAEQSPFIQALERQAWVVKEALGESAKFARLAVGGGTPTFLNIKDLERLFFIITQIMGAKVQDIPASVEMSPKTAQPEKLALLQEYGTTRASIGVQSFILEETKSLGRPQNINEVLKALEAIKDSGIPEMNIDLIYGMDGQTHRSWQYSIEQSMGFEPEEIFLYPLYVRPLTGLGLKEKSWNDHRLDLYRFGRDFLLDNGYEQVTMRLFRRKNIPKKQAPPYTSTKDGMVGLGVGARSYTRHCHYSSEYAVGRKEVQNIIHDYNNQDRQQFGLATYGIELNWEQQKRRFIIKSLLEGSHLDLSDYANFFEAEVLSDFPQLEELYHLDLVVPDSAILKLNQKGLELSDVIGPWLY